MKTKKKVTSMFLVLPMSSCLIACAQTAPTVGDDVVSTEESTEASNESSSVEGTTEGTQSTEIKDGEVVGSEEPAATASPEPTETPQPTASPEPTATPTPEPTPTPHEHVWSESVTRTAGCASDGEKKLTCECGESKVESIPATGAHNWVEGTTVVHHEALGHVEEVQVQTGTNRRTEYACAVCDARFDTPSGVVDHCAAFVPDPHGMANTIMYDYDEPVYEVQSQWVVDTPAWDEVVGTGTYTCSVCGATK